jgi:GlpG protein
MVPVAEGSWVRLPTLVEVSAGLEPIRRGEVWRLFTPMFIHYGLAHLAFNMLALYWFGGLIEMRKGSWILLALVATAAPLSFLAQYLWDLQRLGPDGISLPGGMSGVIYALFGYAWVTGEHEPESGLRLSSNTIVWMLMWLGLCMTGFAGSIANAAHVSGLVWGILFAVVPHLRGRPA